MGKKLELDKSQIRSAKFLEKIAPIYIQGFLEDMMQEKHVYDGYEAIKRFLEPYAYERQGAPEAYSKIALKCIKIKYSRTSWDVPTEKEAADIWEKYKEIARDKFDLWDEKEKREKVNANANPINKDKGVIKKLAQDEVPNIADYVNSLMKEGKTKKAHKFLTGIRGVGEKISSFYLRDIAYLSPDLEEKNISNLHLLQPMDTWLNQTLSAIFNNSPDKLRDKQKLIIKLCEEANISSISFNQGAWVLGSQIAEEFDTLETILKSSNRFKKKIKEHMEEKEKYLRTVKQVYTDFVKNQDN